MTHPWEIPTSWKWLKIGEAASIVGGGTPKTSDPANFEGGETPWITPADLSSYKDKFIARGARNITDRGLSHSSARLLPTKYRFIQFPRSDRVCCHSVSAGDD